MHELCAYFIMERGRPTKYDPKYCDQIIDFFADHELTRERIKFYDKDGNAHTEEVANIYPTITDFAKKIGVNRSSLHEWSRKHKDFSVALKEAKELQHEIIIKSALCGYYNASFSIFAMKNIAGWRDKNEDDKSDDRLESELEFVGVPMKEKDDRFKRYYN